MLKVILQLHVSRIISTTSLEFAHLYVVDSSGDRKCESVTYKHLHTRVCQNNKEFCISTI